MLRFLAFISARAIKLLINYVKDIGFYKLQLWIELLDLYY